MAHRVAALVRHLAPEPAAAPAPAAANPLLISNLYNVAGKVVVVTGGSRGIGAMIARTFVANGCKVYISSRKKDACDKMAAELNAMGPGKCIGMPFDFSTQESCKAFVAALTALGETRVDVLVNNAGALWGESFEKFPDNAWTKIMDLNVKGVFNLTQQLLPLLQAAGTLESPARVINIGSVDGIHIPKYASENQNFSYSASKAAVHHLSRVLARELAPRHITVNAIAPGFFPSNMTKFLLEAAGEEGLSQTILLQRVGRPTDIGGLALFLSSPAASWMTGTVIPCDGGVLVQ
eukprot:TRINITY_DN390_c0_g2_i1.p1 TRINITY_DN390_c0_g2~~TRINITY_DN390_c0_g2_i1.p1  ORF type:complete len:300 (-),score=72.02 TRINITY_DN390_c0_g2_i1:8-886(-)